MLSSPLVLPEATCTMRVLLIGAVSYNAYLRTVGSKVLNILLCRR